MNPDRADQEGAVGEFKSKGGWRRVVTALSYSAAGLRQAWKTEASFRQELVIAVPGTVAALLLPVGALEKLLLVGVLALVLIVELMNSAIEAAIDRVSLDSHPLSRNAKDFGSAAVMIALFLAVLTWAVILWPLLAR